MVSSKQAPSLGLVLFLFVILLGVGGCSNASFPVEQVPAGSIPDVTLPQPQQADSESHLGSIPFPRYVERDSSALSIKTVAGSDFESALQSRNVVPGNPGDPLEFLPATGGDGIAYAIYHLRKSEWNSYTLVTSTWGGTPAQWENLWIGATDWNFGGWKWFDGKSLGKIGALDRLFDSEGDIYIAVVLLGDEPATLDLIELTQGYAGPTPILHTSPTKGMGSVTVTFDGSDSYSTQGKIVKYLWNFRDGTPLLDSTSPVMHRIYSNAGYYQIRLTVEDEEGNRYGVDSDIIVVTAPNTAFLAMSGNRNNLWASGPIDIEGNPGLLVIEENVNAEEGEPEAFLKFTRALDPTGIEWTEPVLIADLSNFSVEDITDEALTIIDGNPAVVFHNGSNILYARASDPLGLSWGEPLVIGVGLNARLKVVNSTPAILYSKINSGLKICFASDSTGTTWEAPIAISPPVFLTYSTSLVFIDGVPAVSWCEGSYYRNSAVYFAKATDSTGLNWNTPVLAYSVDDPLNQDITAYLMVINSRPAFGLHIKDYPVPDKALYMVADDSDGLDWGLPTLIDDQIELQPTVFRGGFDPFGVEKVAVIFREFTLLVTADGTGHLDWDNLKHINTYGIAEYQPVRTTPDFLQTGRFWYKKQEKTSWNDYYMSAIFKTLILD